MQGKGEIVGKRAPDFSLRDEAGQPFRFYDVMAQAAHLLIFYPGDFRMVCTKQLCNYRDNLSRFEELGVRLLGISHNDPHRHAEFRNAYSLSFRLLSDPSKTVARAYGCTSAFLFGAVSRAIAIVNPKGVVLYRYVEPTIITHRNSDELIGVLKDLRTHGLL